MSDQPRPPAPSGEPSAAAPKVTKTRAAGAYKSLLGGAIVLALLLIFILENTRDVKVSYLGASGHLPLGVALLLAAVGGALLLGLVGTVRILQLRRRIRRRGRSRS
jgi:lipopolysaccharide assembly protein A